MDTRVDMDDRRGGTVRGNSEVIVAAVEDGPDRARLFAFSCAVLTIPPSFPTHPPLNLRHRYLHALYWRVPDAS